VSASSRKIEQLEARVRHLERRYSAALTERILLLDQLIALQRAVEDAGLEVVYHEVPSGGLDGQPS
jgi:hypothetical protein